MVGTTDIRSTNHHRSTTGYLHLDRLLEILPSTESTYAGILIREARGESERLGLTGRRDRARVDVSSRQIAAHRRIGVDLVDKWIHAARQLSQHLPELYRRTLDALLAGVPPPPLPAASRLRELTGEVLGLEGEARDQAVHRALTTKARRSTRAAITRGRYPAAPTGAQALRAADRLIETLRQALAEQARLEQLTREGVIPFDDALQRLTVLQGLAEGLVIQTGERLERLTSPSPTRSDPT